MTGMYVTFAALNVAVWAIKNRRRRPQQPATTELTVLAVEQGTALIAYSHPTGSGMFWMGRRQIFEHFMASGSYQTVLRAENTDGVPFEMVVTPSVWADVLEAV